MPSIKRKRQKYPFKQEWVPIKDWPGYEISNWGKVRRVEDKEYYNGYKRRIKLRPRQIKPFERSDYKNTVVVQLSKYDENKNIITKILSLRRLVGLHWLAGCDPNKHFFALDPDRYWDCAVDNIRQIKNITKKGRPAWRLTDKAKEEIRKEIEEKENTRGIIRQLAKKYNVHPSTISKIANDDSRT